jgi:fumarate reductase subunit D
MKHPLLRFEPLIWLLFGQGILIGSILLTGWLLVVGLAAPLGLIPPDALSYERAYALGASWIGRLVLIGLVALPLWKGAHHARHVFIDAGYGEHDGVVGSVLYAVATVGSLLAILAALRL